MRELGNGRAEGLRIVVGAMAGTLLRAQRAGKMVIGEREIGALLGVQSDLEETRKRPAVAARAPRATGANSSGMNNVVARGVLRERGDGCVAIRAFGRADVPLRPAIRSSVGARRLHGGDIVRITGKIRAEPSHYNVSIRVCCNSRESVPRPTKAGIASAPPPAPV